MRRILIRVAYDGRAFHGWERQTAQVTVQGTLEAALAAVTGEERTVVGAGRTDAGVSAIGQAAHFEMESGLPVVPRRGLPGVAPRQGLPGVAGIPNALNAHLPPKLVVRDAVEVGDEFHARYSAKGKRYLYQVVTGPWRPPVLPAGVAYIKGRLDAAAMKEAAGHFCGEHDFSSVASVLNGDRRDPVRELRVCEVAEGPVSFGAPIDDDRLKKVTVVMEAKGFLYKMARGIAGTLLEVGRGARTPESIPELLEARDRSQGGPTAPPEGLTLLDVMY